MKLTALMVTLLLFAGPALATNEKVRLNYSSQLEAMLSEAAATIPPDKQGDYRRLDLACALAKNGNVERASSLIGAISQPFPRSAGWSCLGRAQGKLGRDANGAKASFAKALETALGIREDASDQVESLRQIARNQAVTGDLPGALRVVLQAPESSRFYVLEGVARIAARGGDVKLAEGLLQLAGNEDQRSLANSLLCIGHAKAANQAQALTALKRITRPENRIAALLALYQAGISSEGEQARLLPEALSLVPQVVNENELDYRDALRNHYLAAIALAQIQTKNDAAVMQAMQTLARIEDASPAKSLIETIARTLAGNQQVEEALQIATLPNLSDTVRFAACISMLEALGDKWPDAKGAAADALAKDMGKVIDQAITVSNTMSHKDQQAAIAGLAGAMAHIHSYDLVETFLAKLEWPSYRAAAYRGIALAAMEQNNPARAMTNLARLSETAAETPPSANILTQAISTLLDELLDDEPVDLYSVLAGLD